MKKEAEQDEFRILKAQIDKRFGKQPRLSKKQMRKRSDEDIEKYNQLAMADEQEMEHEYQSDYRGRVQNRKVGMDYLPMYALTTERFLNDVKRDIAYDRQVEVLNQKLSAGRQLHISCNQTSLSEAGTQRYFNRIDSLTREMGQQQKETDMLSLLMQRAVAYSVIQNYEGAIDDLTTYIMSDSLSAVAYWQRAVCQSRLNEFNAAQGTDVKLQTARVLADLTEAIRLNSSCAYLYYNRGNVYVQRHDYQHAIDDYNRAIELEPHLAEAFYNRGLVRFALKEQQEGTADLSKAGELGLYQAYSIIKQNRR
jgi:tetratricopeptide (TPR) repeat protein